MTNVAADQKSKNQPLNVANLQSILKEAVLDPEVNIKIATLGGDSTLMMGATELQPGAKLNAHVHANDAEVYYILKGVGSMYTGEKVDQQVHWYEPVQVKEGDVFTVNPGVVHQLHNTSDRNSLILVFSSPWSHLKGDRVVTEDYPLRPGI
jgi:mannose-6-phosphate isomerase-like protein (cupin superfamily)